MEFIVGTRWAGHGKYRKFELSVSIKYRNALFPQQGRGDSIHVKLPNENEFHRVKLNPSFWRKCNHFGSKEISKWLKENNHVPYEKGKPPKFRMKKLDEGKFQILGLVGK